MLGTSACFVSRSTPHALLLHTKRSLFAPPPSLRAPHLHRPFSTTNRIMSTDFKFIATDKATPVAGPYSQAVLVPNTAQTSTLWLSGQLPATPKMELLTGQPMDVQAKACIANLEAIVKASHPGATLKNIVKVVIFLTDMANFKEANKGFEEAFAGHKPARSTVAVKELPLGVAIEMEAVAIV